MESQQIHVSNSEVLTLLYLEQTPRLDNRKVKNKRIYMYYAI